LLCYLVATDVTDIIFHPSLLALQATDVGAARCYYSARAL
jgi:hypothetical protein